MRRMNLLPAELRPRKTARGGSSYVVVGALASAIVAMLLYGFVISQVRSDEKELAALQSEAADAQASADALAPYAQFAQLKETRATSVRSVAEQRYDYERLTRELALVLPDGVWVSQLELSTAAPDQAAALGADNPDAAALPDVPTLKLSGCARSQPAVADAIDRLAALTGATKVELGSSGEADESSGEGAPSAAPAGAGPGSCSAGRRTVNFDVTVTLSPGGGGAGGTGS